MSGFDDQNESCIAVIGMAGRFPGAEDVAQFWKNLCSGTESIVFFSDEELRAEGYDDELLSRPECVKARGLLEDIERFDAEFFGYSRREAEVMDPQQRIFLESAWTALEDAGYTPEGCPGPVGVFAGSSMNTYFLGFANDPELRKSAGDFLLGVGSEKDFLPTRVSFKLDLKGPSVSIQTACSTSLVAVHAAVQSLLNGECDMALAGGVSAGVPQKSIHLYQRGGIASPDGHCRAFDASAEGTVGGSGVGIVVLKRLDEAIADRDQIYAVIRGSAVNNDGADKIGFTAPSIEGQRAVIQEALEVAGVEPEDLAYVEAHGTGTPLGDPIEVAALKDVWGDAPADSCGLGSVKTNIGHLDAAAGVAGLIKTVLAVRHGQVPPSLHFERPNPKIDFANSPFYVNTRLRSWEASEQPRCAGVSSFGIGGTNAHVIVAEGPQPTVDAPSRPNQLLLLSARSSEALDRMSVALGDHLDRHDETSLADAAYTLQVGRRPMRFRRTVVCGSRREAVAALRSPDLARVTTSVDEGAVREVAFLFPGQGAQFVGMGQALYQHEDLFRQEIDRCAEILRPVLGMDLRHVLYPTSGDSEEATQRLTQTQISQPALFAVEYALAKLWIAWGVRPIAMMGHSIGEYVAACLAGVFSLEDGLLLVADRGRLMQAQPSGAMLTLALPEDQVLPLLGDDLDLAAVNGPARCVVSGPESAVEGLEQRLKEREGLSWK
ncbi:MAG: type I polyketide synthase, partial [Acidobacteriota bacterium]